MPERSLRTDRIGEQPDPPVVIMIREAVTGEMSRSRGAGHRTTRCGAVAALHVVTVELGDGPRRPVLIELGELLRQVDTLQDV